MEGSFGELQEKVIGRGLCTACGTCAGVCPVQAVDWAEMDGEPVPELAGACANCGICPAVCPGAEVNIPVLEKFIFGRERPEEIPDLGFYREALLAWSADLPVRKRGASGGLVTSVLVYALEEGIIDCALVAGFRRDDPCRTGAWLAASKEDILAAAQSKYACVPVNTLLSRALAQGYRRIAAVGLPCQIHGLRKMQYLGRPASMAKSIVFMTGLFCAAQFYFEGTRHLIVERLGLTGLDEIAAMSYRGGDWPGHLVVELKDGRRLLLDRHQYMYHHLMPAFKRDRCEMCVDWSAELADLSVGDYWDPGARAGEALGTSSCLVRTAAGEEVLKGAVQSGYLETAGLEARRLAAGLGFELKKHAAAFRLKQRRRFGWPVPEYHRETDYEPFPREQHLAPETKTGKE
ncbi:MAG: 4Fe-4S binding protein [Pelotomaculum sp.]|uniref:Coenzyme F420-reducing hydrogenase, beta subunit n=1 Tax=Pelotomaculum thermopropionicum (strain DSM 13744 / JCM 10971 / SI) TaxID=370438 RepID=A5D272_PELTS|nr:4Fe-4S binding protein [Pelotomaculum sp.]BAF59673.1 coenzyme F420-reducing hydrogenase, beta subunit [Pelotomaculum thermopropionicum SI]